MKATLVLLAGLALVLSAATANAKRAPTDYAAYAGEPVEEVRFSELYNWERSTDKEVVLWSRPGTAFLVSLAHTCDGLRGSSLAIQSGGFAGLPGTSGRLRVGDDLIVEPIKCRVTAIRPLDLAAMKLARK